MESGNDTPRLWLAVSNGALLALIASVGVTFVDWLSNPGGVFRDENGTHWPAVWETFASWLFPLLMLASTLAVVVALIWRMILERRNQ